MRLLNFVLALASLAAAVPSAATAQTASPAKAGTATMDQTADAGDAPGLTGAEKRLVAASRLAILKAGFSEAYFDRHFRPARVVDQQGDRRVLWRFTLGDYEALVSDAVGFYTDAGGRRVDTHSAGTTLGAAHDVTRVIPRRRAEAITRRCLGAFSGGSVAFQPQGEGGRTALVFIAYSAAKSRREDREGRAQREREGRERAERESAEKKRGRQGARADVPEEGDEGGGAPLYIAVTDLETGRCVKGLAVSGPPMVGRRR